MSGYSKLWSHIVTSTIWTEDDKTRIVWITMLAMSEVSGYVAGSIPGLARLANVSVKDCEIALGKLSSPDSYSRTKDHEGRRISDSDGGWIVLNYTKHREAIAIENRKAADRARAKRYRDKKKGKLVENNNGLKSDRIKYNITRDDSAKNGNYTE